MKSEYKAVLQDILKEHYFEKGSTSELQCTLETFIGDICYEEYEESYNAGFARCSEIRNIGS